MNIQIDIATVSVESPSFSDVLMDLVKEIEVRNYRVTRIYDIDNVLEQTERGLSDEVTFEHYKIVEFCNLSSCAELISSNLTAGVFMPVKFTVYKRRGDEDVSISFLKPTAFARLFDSGQLLTVAEKLESDMQNVVQEMAF